MMETFKTNFSLLRRISSETISAAKSWIANPDNTNKKIFICMHSIWILTDFAIAILQHTTNTEERNVLGPFTYISAKLALRNRYNPSSNTLIFGIPSNLQFSSSKGLAKNMLGGYAIGIAFGISAYSILQSIISSNKESVSSIIRSITPWSLYVCSSCVFYTLEYLWSAIFHPKDVSFDSFMVFNHSNSFHIALALSASEYWIEYLLFHQLKVIDLDNAIHPWLSKTHLIGFGMVVIGQIVRTLAQFTAGINFTHQIAYYKKEHHELIKHGVYRWLRHPSYFGFFYWSIGTQLLLANPMSTLFYTLASWMFFADRIPFEEKKLIEFFGDDYVQYTKQTFVGIPFIY